MRGRSTTALLVGALLLASCGAPGGQGGYAIVGGDPTTDFEPVVSVYWLGGFLCSAVVVGPRRVLTAAHCLYGFPDDPAALSVRFGPQGETPDSERLAAAFTVHPDYSTSVGRDVATIDLVEDAPVAPLAWRRDPLGDEQVGAALTIVGFGLTAAGQEDPSIFRRRAEVEVREVTALQLRWQAAGANVCDGDSGGAAFLDGQLVGLLVEGDAFCVDWGAALRLDAVSPWLEGEPAGDDDDATVDLPSPEPPPAASGCSVIGAYPSTLPLLLLLLTRRRRPSAIQPAP